MFLGGTHQGGILVGEPGHSSTTDSRGFPWADLAMFIHEKKWEMTNEKPWKMEVWEKKMEKMGVWTCFLQSENKIKLTFEKKKEVQKRIFWGDKNPFKTKKTWFGVSIWKKHPTPHTSNTQQLTGLSPAHDLIALHDLATANFEGKYSHRKTLSARSCTPGSRCMVKPTGYVDCFNS